MTTHGGGRSGRKRKMPSDWAKEHPNELEKSLALAVVILVKFLFANFAL